MSNAKIFENEEFAPQKEDTSNIMQSPSGSMVSDGNFHSPNYNKGGPGWNIDAKGNAYFNNITTATKLVWNTDGVIIPVDWSQGNAQAVILKGNRTITWSKQGDGQVLYFLIVQDSSGSRTLTWPATVKWPGGTPAVLTTLGDAADLIVFLRDTTNNNEYAYITVKNYACFLEGTLISTPSGDVPIENLKIRDTVLSLNTEAKVTNILVRGSLSHYIVTLDDTSIKVTGEHPCMLPNGDFRMVKDLKVGDELKTEKGDKKITSIVLVDVFAPVYNITIEEPNIYLANGIYVHNKVSP